MASIVKSTPGAIGYVDYATAKASGLSFASVQNKAGDYVAPSPTGSSADAADATVKADLTFAAADASSAPTAYPVTYQSWDLVYAQQPNANDAAMLKAYLGYLLGAGQQLLPSLVLRAAAVRPRPEGRGAAEPDHLLLRMTFMTQASVSLTGLSS